MIHITPRLLKNNPMKKAKYKFLAADPNFQMPVKAKHKGPRHTKPRKK
jgi:hypothetical protein